METALKCGRVIKPVIQQVENMQIHYLEIVTPDIDTVCSTYESVHGVQFGLGDPGLGNARTAMLENRGMIGVRLPMHETEEPTVRSYLLVEDIDKAVASVVESGGKIAHPPLEIPVHGKFAIYILGGTSHGLWQV